jgi:hypothetical protein
MEWNLPSGLFIFHFLDGEEASSLTARVQRAQSSITSHQGMGQIAERFAEGAGTLREFAEEESGN